MFKKRETKVKNHAQSPSGCVWWLAVAGILVASPAWIIHPKLQRKKNVAVSAGEE
jgi:hypothetical protein